MKKLALMLAAAFLVLTSGPGIAQPGPDSPLPGPERFAAYGWMEEERDTPRLTSLEQAFEPPEGYTRIDLETGSFGAWLRGLPLRLDREHVLARSGRRLASPSAAVIYLNVLRHQQCADSAIRLHAEWLWSQSRPDAIAYHFTSGDLSTWQQWSQGERFRVAGSLVRRVNTGTTSRGRDALEAYLGHLFTYAGTRSLHRDSRRTAPSKARPGDFFVAPGSPGHAVVILDIVQSDDGKRRALIGQGFMPTQEFHVVRSHQALEHVWFELPETEEDMIKTPSWEAFRGADLRRFDH